MCPRSSDPESNDSAVVTGSVNPSPGPDQDTHFYNLNASEKPSLDLQSMKYFYFLEERAILLSCIRGSNVMQCKVHLDSHPPISPEPRESRTKRREPGVASFEA
jgi:hypothetical protein